MLPQKQKWFIYLFFLLAIPFCRAGEHAWNIWQLCHVGCPSWKTVLKTATSRLQDCSTDHQANVLTSKTEFLGFKYLSGKPLTTFVHYQQKTKKITFCWFRRLKIVCVECSGIRAISWEVGFYNKLFRDKKLRIQVHWQFTCRCWETYGDLKIQNSNWQENTKRNFWSCFAVFARPICFSN